MTWEITAEPYRSCHCHCKMCRKAHGAPFGTYWFVRPEQFNWTGDTATVVRYQSSDQLERAFCGTCGSVVPYSGDFEDRVVIPAGSHNGPSLRL